MKTRNPLFALLFFILPQGGSTSPGMRGSGSPEFTGSRGLFKIINRLIMLHLSRSCRYYLCPGATDMRKHFDSLSGLVSSGMHGHVLGGDIFIFINKRRNQIKLLLFEGDGFAIYHKRLEKGTYELPAVNGDAASIAVSHEQLLLLLQGISLQYVRKRKRYQHRPLIC